MLLSVFSLVDWMETQKYPVRKNETVHKDLSFPAATTAIAFPKHSTLIFHVYIFVGFLPSLCSPHLISHTRASAAS